MITDPEHPYMKAAGNELAVFLQSHFVGRELNANALVDLNNIIVRHRKACRQRGIDFPAMALIVFPSARFLSLVNADLDEKSVNVTLDNLLKVHRNVPRKEIYEAVRRAFPNVRLNAEAVFNDTPTKGMQ